MQRSLGWMMLLAVAAAAVGACGSVARASVNGDTISIAFGRDEPPTTPGCFLAPTDVAGVQHFRSAHWNNEVGNFGAASNPLGGGRNRPAEFFVIDPAKANPKYIIPGGNNHSYTGPNYVQAIGDDAQLGATGS